MNPTISDLTETITAAELRRLSAEAEPTLVDVRGYGEFAQSRLVGAMCIPLDELAARAAELPAGRPVICVCASGRRSEQAARELRARGIAAQHLAGGLAAWKAQGFPIWRQPTWALERQVRLGAGMLVLLGLIAAQLWAPARLLAWLVGTGLVFAALSDTC